METNNDKLKSLKSKLHSVTKKKLRNEHNYQKLHHLELIKSDELKEINEEIELLKLQLNELKDEVIEAQEQLFNIETYKLSAEIEVNGHKLLLEDHRKGFLELFRKEQQIAQDRYRELQDKENAQLENEKQTQQQMIIENEKQLIEVTAIETECEAIEMECIVLKKRNAAIMLKLRRKLVDTDDIRRSLTKKESHTADR